MQTAADQLPTDLYTLVALIARSPIVVRGPFMGPLPPGYEAVDIAILEWIALEAQRLGRCFEPM